MADSDYPLFGVASVGITMCRDPVPGGSEMPCALSGFARAVRIGFDIAAVRAQVAFVWGCGVGGPHGPGLGSHSFSLTRGGAATIVQGD